MANVKLKASLGDASNLPGNVVKTDTYTAQVTDYVIVCNKGTAMTINLFAATGSNKILKIKSIGAGVVTVDGDGSETIDSSTTATLNQWDAIEIMDYASGKWIIL